MQIRNIILVLLVIFSVSAGIARAENTPAAAPVPANMSDEALASYISGRLKLMLNDQDYKVSQACDETGCSVVVQ